MKITIDDIRAAGFCVTGARRWFEAHGIPFNTFLREGIDAQEFIENGDELSRMVVAAKEARGG